MKGGDIMADVQKERFVDQKSSTVSISPMLSLSDEALTEKPAGTFEKPLGAHAHEKHPKIKK